MAASTAILGRRTLAVSSTRQRTMGIIFILIGLAGLVLFARITGPDVETRFVMTPGGIDRGAMPDWVLPSQITLILMGVIGVLAGIYQLAFGFGRYTNPALGVVVAAFVFAFLVWSAAGTSLNLAGMLGSAVTLAVPITLGAFSGILSERAGVVNIAIEGMMLMGAMVGAIAGTVAGSMWVGVLAAILAGLLLALVHAFLSIRYKIDQIISGTVINIFATGFTSYISAKFLQVYQNLNASPIFPRWPVPVLADIPLLGPIFFNTTFFVYAMFILMIVLQIALFSTRWGLRMRAVGEHPKAADTLGINVHRTRYMAVMLSGMMAGLAGAYFTVGAVGRFDEMMTAGRGFIGLAAMIFGNWTPVGAFGSGVLFGMADSIASKLSILGSTIPPQFMSMAPYITTIIVLAGVIGRSQAPAADGEAYEKE